LSSLRLARVGAIGVDQVVVLDVVDRPPGGRKGRWRAERVAHRIEVHPRRPTARSCAHGVADGPAQPVGECGVEPQPVRRRQDGRGAVPVPELGDVDGARFVEADRRRQVPAEAGASVVADDAHLVVAEPVDVELVEKEAGVVDEELAHLVAPIGVSRVTCSWDAGIAAGAPVEPRTRSAGGRGGAPDR
jgi:hypothetical protein